jgi:molybdopterin/thiamine biosynthesis adenylyltransferase
MRQSTGQPDTLRDARALIIGVGGLGAPAAMALAAAGVGTLGLVDPDRVELSNLHRQPLYGEADLGRLKVEAAAAQLRAAQPAIHVETWRVRFDLAAAALVDGFDVVLDGTDSVAAKFAINDAAVAHGVPLVHAGAIGTRAQLLTIVPGETTCYRCLFEEPPPADEVASCQEAGVLGPSVVLAGTLQAADAIRLLSGAAPLFANRLLALDTAAGSWRCVVVTPRPGCPTCGASHRETITPTSIEGSVDS